jgi:hypothetical protein
MFKLPLTAALLVAAVAAPAAAQEKASFTYEGVTYSYTQEKVGNTTILKGSANTGDRFHYSIRNGRVVGKSNGVPVKFSVEDAVVPQGVTLVAAG